MIIMNNATFTDVVDSALSLSPPDNPPVPDPEFDSFLDYYDMVRFNQR